MTQIVAQPAADAGKSTANGVYVAVCGLFVTSTGYALLLNTEQGRRWDAQHNWFVVMVGVLLTLAWLAVIDPRAAAKAFAAFVVSGAADHDAQPSQPVGGAGRGVPPGPPCRKSLKSGRRMRSVRWRIRSPPS